MLLSLRSRLPLVIVVAIASAACGSGKKNRRVDGNVQRLLLGTPLDYRLDDPGCQRGDGVATIGSQGISTWTGEASARNRVQIAINGKESVSSSLISATGYDYHSRSLQNCTISENSDVACDPNKTTEVISQVKDLKLCKTDADYPRESIEGATLATIAGLEQAFGLYKGLGGAATLPQAQLLMMPKYEDLVDAHQPSSGRRIQITSTKTDNAGFGAMADGQIYVVFPKSEEMAAKAAWKDVNLWEIPWVMAHEFSHQVFAAHYDNYLNDSRTTSRAMAFGHGAGLWKNDRDLRRELGDESGASLTSVRKVTVKDALSAVNEGFADLLAVHMLGVEKNHAANLPCFDKSRDVNSAFFADGIAKSFDQDARDKFFGIEPGEEDEGCERTDFTDSHHIGAILAHGITKLFATALPADATAKTRSELLLKWIDAFDAARRAGAAPTAESLLTMAVKSAVDTAKGPAETIAPAQCAIVKEVFPVYAATVAPGC